MGVGSACSSALNEIASPSASPWQITQRTLSIPATASRTLPTNSEVVITAHASASATTWRSSGAGSTNMTGVMIAPTRHSAW